jgi:beta-galactosidase/beta-glucuronidase
VLHNANHACVFVWSIGNELAGSRGENGRVGSGFATFISQAKREVKQLDPTRPVAIDRQSRIGEPIFHPALAQLDVLGVNEYFGWYDSYALSKPRDPARTDELGLYLDQVHKAYPRTPLFVTEFGAEGTRSGPVTQKGSLEFQAAFMRQHHAIHASKRYINGSIAWALRDFRVEPGWTGGAPREWSSPPWHNKSLIDESGNAKPAFGVMQRLWRRTRQLR